MEGNFEEGGDEHIKIQNRVIPTMIMSPSHCQMPITNRHHIPFLYYSILFSLFYTLSHNRVHTSFFIPAFIPCFAIYHINYQLFYFIGSPSPSSPTLYYSLFIYIMVFLLSLFYHFLFGRENQQFM